MKLVFTNDVPIYIQIAQAIEDNILKDIFKEKKKGETYESISYGH